MFAMLLDAGPNERRLLLERLDQRLLLKAVNVDACTIATIIPHVIKTRFLTTLSVAYDDYGLLKTLFKALRRAVPRFRRCLAAVIRPVPLKPLLM